ncbi:TIGR02588 family protein [Microcoleus sp. FACHB-672]|uniref:TIGR02588 family protein n=1 Tax=Microcoleus sp. FACHB-672 TaxID=2692825 RepID=UPI0016897C82|nr:TIGR02588 family protein [Microcoleus sp. FACHB-672]MBD2041047.1 TIGR02588 family protein [Microcoleus sp. FACHB-672]
MSQSNPQKNSPSELQHEGRSPAELVTFSISLSILAALVGLVCYDWFTRRDEPPVLAVVRDGAIRNTQGQFYVPFEIKNTGGNTADSVQVIGELRINGEVQESGEQQIDFLSGGEAEKGAFIFTRNPKEGELVLRIGSYKSP